MTANLPPSRRPTPSSISLGIVAEDRPRSGTPHQDYEVPRRDQFARFLNHFGTAHKAMLVTADLATTTSPPGTARLRLVDRGHDLATARTDLRAAYQAV